MNVEIETETAQFLFWKYIMGFLFQLYIGSTALSATFVKDKVVTSKLLKKPSTNVKYFGGNFHSNHPDMNLSFFFDINPRSCWYPA